MNARTPASSIGGLAPADWAAAQAEWSMIGIKSSASRHLVGHTGMQLDPKCQDGIPGNQRAHKPSWNPLRWLGPSSCECSTQLTRGGHITRKPKVHHEFCHMRSVEQCRTVDTSREKGCRGILKFRSTVPPLLHPLHCGPPGPRGSAGTHKATPKNQRISGRCGVECCR
jgi:hypothetical protein